uniref:Uncharacterized protein n=1 Tax=Zea mays TaxID=4577 RepID=B4FK68_MAIZE|nr:unknown [Zea mays]
MKLGIWTYRLVMVHNLHLLNKNSTQTNFADGTNGLSAFP